MTKIQQAVADMCAIILDCVTTQGTDLVLPFLQFESTEPLLTFINTVYESLIIFGVGMLIIYFLAEMNKTLFMAGNNMTMQHIFNPLLKLVAGYIIIAKGGTIIGYFLSFNNWWVNLCGTMSLGTLSGGFDANGFQAGIEGMITGMGVVEVCLTFIPFLLMWGITQVIQFVFVYKALIWKLELSLRIAFAPISLGDIYDGKNGNAVRYLKKILSMVLYAGGMILVCKFGTVMYYGLWSEMQDAVIGLQSDVLNPNLWQDMFVSPIAGILSVIPLLALAVVIPLIELGAIKVVKQICDDTLG